MPHTRRHVRSSVRRPVRRSAFLLALVALFAAGCGGEEKRSAQERRQRLESTGPGRLMRDLVRDAIPGRYGSIWDRLDPAGQRLVGRDRFSDCLRRGAAGAAIPLSEIPVTVVRVRERGQEAAVVLRAATPVGPVTRMIEAIEIDDLWRWRLPRDLASAFAAGRCPGGP